MFKSALPILSVCRHLPVVRSQSRADQIEVSLNEDIKSKEGRKMKQRQVQNTTLCAPRPHCRAQVASVHNTTPPFEQATPTLPDVMAAVCPVLLVTCLALPT